MTATAQPFGDTSLRRTGTDWAGLAFHGVLLISLLVSLLILFTLISDVVTRGLPVLAERGTDFLTAPTSSRPARAGVAQGIFGTLMMAVFVAIIAFPIGIMTAIYLEEYAPDNRLTRFINVNIRNLAGVPSVVYGLLGLSIFVLALRDLTGGRSMIAGGITLAVLVLPIVIITSAEAFRAVPRALREAGFGVGASRWEVTRLLVIPHAAPGILTGTVLALSRALGETAPLILAGAVLGGFSTGSKGIVEQIFGRYTVLPVTIFDWARRPQADFRELTAAAIVVLLVVTLLANAIAILLRNRYDGASS
ncbi:MAG TPA: phosphate ABC transporter permease PstA [Candidatus Limnocylindrales bacterium]|jgi:phosphate transport system permease protein|nr:phosphate ABC transporter permease PstA [Candidatus Limnocylindrales bacterium]